MATVLTLTRTQGTVSMKPITIIAAALVLVAGCDQPPQQATAPANSIAPIQAVEPVIVQAQTV